MTFTIFKQPLALLCLIVILAGFLRFYQLGTNPPALTWDEVAWGYNAYAIGIDGKDEFGHFLPYTSFVSFGDYKPPVYAYLIVLPVWLFGLTEVAVRFPSAFLGTLTVGVTYFLVKELFEDRRFKKNQSQSYIEVIALTSSLFLAISPWHIMLSRAAFEANVASFFIVTGVWLFLLAIRRNSWFLILSVCCFVLCMYTFNSVRVDAPLLFIVLILGNVRQLLKIKKTVITSFIIGLVILLPIIPFLFSHQAKLRYQEVNIFSDITIVKTVNQEIANDHNAWWSKIIHNRRVAYMQVFMQHYFDNLNSTFLFINGDHNPKFSTQDVGQMYLWDLPFLVIGTIFLFCHKRGKWWIIPIWLVIGIIPAGLSLPTPHALRSEGTLPTWQILIAYGFVTSMAMIRRYQKIIVSSLIVILLLFVGYYLHGYYTHYPKEYSAEWQYSYKQIIHYVEIHQQQYKTVYITGVERPYIYTLFYLKYPPQEFRQTAKYYTDVFGFVHVDSFGKYQFPTDPPAKITNSALYIGSIAKVPPKVHILQKFYYLDGTPSLVAYTK